MKIAQQIQQILKSHQLSITDSRSKILELFLQQNAAMAHADIEKKSETGFDRVTIYRTLQTFVEKGIVHTIPTVDNAVMYALCKDECTEGHHQHQHIHFLCKKCASTLCLQDVNIPNIQLPKGYQPTQIEIIVNGICKSCK